jgi:hypothetical protein
MTSMIFFKNSFQFCHFLKTIHKKIQPCFGKPYMEVQNC